MKTTQFQIDPKGKTGKGIPESSRCDSLEKLFVNSFALREAEDKTSGTIKSDIAYLTLLRTLTAIRIKS